MVAVGLSNSLPIDEKSLPSCSLKVFVLARASSKSRSTRDVRLANFSRSAATERFVSLGLRIVVLASVSCLYAVGGELFRALEDDEGTPVDLCGGLRNDAILEQPRAIDRQPEVLTK
ncbi:hypothetical protein FRC19_003984 [Serendipita sp. 401]|nr:hypothetical protein FRC19_003984 [Serendipita sp. 401]